MGTKQPGSVPGSNRQLRNPVSSRKIMLKISIKNPQKNQAQDQISEKLKDLERTIKNHHKLKLLKPPKKQASLLAS